jgi:hypothetical protein
MISTTAHQRARGPSKRKVVIPTPPSATPSPPPQSPPAPFRSIEREAWDKAYSGPEVGPVGASWPEDGRHVPRMVWKLALHELSRTPRRAFTPRIAPNH